MSDRESRPGNSPQEYGTNFIKSPDDPNHVGVGGLGVKIGQGETAPLSPEQNSTAPLSPEQNSIPKKEKGKSNLTFSQYLEKIKRGSSEE